MSSSSGPSSQESLRIQLNNIDYYQHPPGTLDKSQCMIGGINVKYPQVPVIRVFGSTSSGQTVMAHIHGVFPYLYIEYTGSMDIPSVNSAIKRLYEAINWSLSMAYSRDPQNSRSSFVANIILCKGVPFYGFHVGWKAYFKIYMLNPANMNKFADLLRTGKVLGKVLQPYESHIPYIMQFLTDFNLYGCGWINLSKIYYRHPLPSPEESSINSKTVPSSAILPAHIYPKMSFCGFEIDLVASSILNRYDLKPRNLHNDFLEKSNPISHDFKFLSSMKELWKVENERRAKHGIPLYTPPPNISRHISKEGWREQEKLKLKLDILIKESGLSSKGDIGFQNMVPNFPSDRHVPPAFETVDLMFKGIAESLEPPPDRSRKRRFQRYLDQNSEDEDEAEIRSRSFDDDGDDDSIEDSEKSSSVNKHSSVDSKIWDEISSQDLLTARFFDGSQRSKHDTSSQSSMTEYMRIAISKSMQASQTKISPPNGSVASSIQPLSSISSHGLLSLDEISRVFGSYGQLYGYQLKPPSANEVMTTFEQWNLPTKVHKDPFYSDLSDVSSIPYVHAGVEYKLKDDTVPSLEPFFLKPVLLPKSFDSPSHYTTKQYLLTPPSRDDVKKWLLSEKLSGSQSKSMKSHKAQPSQIKGPTQANKFGFKYPSPKERSTESFSNNVYMSVFCLEIHANCREGKLADPVHDEVSAIFWSFRTNGESISGIIFLTAADGIDDLVKSFKSSAPKGVELAHESSELDIFSKLVGIVRLYDPDILAGYEIHSSSWGYLIERAQCQFDYNLCEELSRVSSKGSGRIGDRWGLHKTSAIQVTGRHIYNIWRILKGELNLMSYTLENVVFHVLHERTPHYSSQQLTQWFKGLHLNLVLKFYHNRVNYCHMIIDSQELVSRTSEQARLLGIDFASVYYRGSQFKVEAILSRIAKAENFILISPSRKQVGEQNALECIPLVMEPQSTLYTSPVAVLDFQSLYPSIMIAYNYCYSTCLGRIEPWRGKNKLGVLGDLDLKPGLIELLQNDLNISPNGMIFVKQSIRRSSLAKMLTEFLDTRVMIKDGMKTNRNDTSFQRLMNNRQLALKLIANVTYGYTSASFSGRMPCVEIADAIVQTGREILEKSIQIINQTSKWGAEVVYGDTDSLFVHLPGKTKDQAFEVANDIAATITGMYPSPVKLKVEKIYLPCVMQTKKRYVGYMYETPDQKVPVFDAKGMETIRRDGTPAQQKIEEKALRILFETADLSQVKKYLQEEWTKIMAGKVSIQDFCFAKEVRIGSYKDEAHVPPGAAIAAKKMQHDHRAEPQYRERVPYVVISGAPGDRLVDRSVAPEVLLANTQLSLDAEYYISKNLIPPLERIFNLFGANIKAWYYDMPKIYRVQGAAIDATGKRSNLTSYMKSAFCIVCLKNETESTICDQCHKSVDKSLSILYARAIKHQKDLMAFEAICRNCANLPPGFPVKCDSGDCPIYYSRVRAQTNVESSTRVELSLAQQLEW